MGRFQTSLAGRVEGTNRSLPKDSSGPGSAHPRRIAIQGLTTVIVTWSLAAAPSLSVTVSWKAPLTGKRGSRGT